MKSAVTVSLVEAARGGPFVFWDDLPAACASAKRLGFDAIELFAPDPLTIPAATLKSLIDDHNLSLAAVGTGAGWVVRKLSLTSPDAKIRRQARDFIRSMIEYGGPFGAPAIIGSMQGRWGDGVSREQALGWLGEALVDLEQTAKEFGVPLIYEPLNRYETNLCRTLGEGVDLLRAAGCSHVKLLADLFHLFIEEANVADSIRAHGATVGHVHFVDTNRRAVGFGHADFGPIVRALKEVGYRGYLSAEAFPLPDGEATAAQTIRAVRYWTQQ